MIYAEVSRSMRTARWLFEGAVAVIAVLLVLGAVGLTRVWFEIHLTQSFCATDPKQLHRLTAVRGLAVFLAVFLLLIVRPQLGKWADARSAKAALASVGRIGLAVLLALAVSDCILRKKETDDEPKLPPIHSDDELGWAGEPLSTLTLPADDRQIPYAFNADAFRAATIDEPKDFSLPSILFAGESITEGVGVRWEETYAALASADLKVQPVEAASHGYGSDLIYLITLRELAKLQHPVAVVTFFIPQLLERDLDPTRPRLILDEGNLLKVPAASAPSAWWKASPVRKLAHNLFPYHDDSAIELTRAIFRATATAARSRGAYPLFVMTNWGAPCMPPAAGNPSLEQRIFGSLGVPWIEVVLDPNEKEHTTHHPNAKSHRMIADAIERALIEAKVGAN